MIRPLRFALAAAITALTGACSSYDMGNMRNMDGGMICWSIRIGS